jgi:hypothetical protein
MTGYKRATVIGLLWLSWAGKFVYIELRMGGNQDAHHHTENASSRGAAVFTTTWKSHDTTERNRYDHPNPTGIHPDAHAHD